MEPAVEQAVEHAAQSSITAAPPATRTTVSTTATTATVADPTIDETNTFLKIFAPGTWRSDTWQRNPPDAATATPDLLALVHACPPLGDEDATDWITGGQEAGWRPVARARREIFRHLVTDGPGWPLARVIWDKATSPMARACLFCEANLGWTKGAWWDDPRFVAQALEVMATLVADDRFLPQSTWGVRNCLRFLDWDRGARCWAPRLWLKLLRCATNDLEDTNIGPFFAAYVASGVPPMPKDLLVELLAHKRSEVRLWAQCEIARHEGEAPEREEPAMEGPRDAARVRIVRVPIQP